jgi:DNA-binding beta-propeller fold protein YncE
MKKQFGILLATALLSASKLAVNVQAQDNPPLKLIQKIPIPKVVHFDHLSVDLKGQRLFAVANPSSAVPSGQHSVEVIDLKTGKWVFSISGQSYPHSAFYSPDFKRLFVANAKDSTCKIFGGDNFKLIVSLPLMGSGPDANDGTYDPAQKYVYIGVGDGNAGNLAIIDTHSNKHVGDIKTSARPIAVTLENSGPRIFMRLSGPTDPGLNTLAGKEQEGNLIGVVDRKKREQIATWPVTGTESIGDTALDEGHHRLFVASRRPNVLVVLDSDSGKQITQLETITHVDGLWYDATHQRIYASGDDGIAVYDQKDADNYSPMVKVANEPRARTSIWVPELNRLYVPAPPIGDRGAEILVYEAQD